MGPKKVLLLKTGSMTGSGLPRTSSRVESIFLRSDNCFLFPSLRFMPPNAPLSPVGDNPVFPRRAQLTVSGLPLHRTRPPHPTPKNSSMKLFFVEPAICLSAFAMTLTSPLTTQYVYRRIWQESGNYSMASVSNVSDCDGNKSSPIFAFQEVSNHNAPEMR